MAIAVVNVAVLLQLDQTRRFEEVCIALGAVRPRRFGCPQAEAVLKRPAFDEALIDTAAASAARECAPIDDVRASAGYRRQMVKVLVRRGLHLLADT